MTYVNRIFNQCLMVIKVRLIIMRIRSRMYIILYILVSVFLMSVNNLI
jgi:hypothetical protein